MLIGNTAIAGGITTSVIAQGGVRVSQLPTPTGLVVAAGSSGAAALVAGTYAYRVSAVSALGEETLACAEVSAFIAGGGFNAANLSWTAVAGASSYKVYGRLSGVQLFMATVTSPFFQDLGTITPAGALPVTNTTGKLETDQTAAATTLGTVVRRLEIFDAAGTSLGFIPIYDSIT
jgi:hypothetical protein